MRRKAKTAIRHHFPTPKGLTASEFMMYAFQIEFRLTFPAIESYGGNNRSRDSRTNAGSGCCHVPSKVSQLNGDCRAVKLCASPSKNVLPLFHTFDRLLSGQTRLLLYWHQMIFYQELKRCCIRFKKR